MKIKCENFIICGVHNCVFNCDGRCENTAIALDAAGECVVKRPRREHKAAQNPTKENFNIG